MVISCSRRTDIPAFYSKWFMNRIRAGYLLRKGYNNLPNRVSLKPEDVDAIVFWTKDPKPLMRYLPELDSMGYKYYFQYTLNNYPTVIEPNLPSFMERIDTFRDLSTMIGKRKVIWRYDPIILSNVTDQYFHIREYKRIAALLQGYTTRSVISIVDAYKKTRTNLRALQENNINVIFDHCHEDLESLMSAILDHSNQYNIEVTSCGEPDLEAYGIKSGKCIDEELMNEVLGTNLKYRKDPSQRKACLCMVSTDIGEYNTCLHNCKYCYATQNFRAAQNKHKLHNPDSKYLIGE